MSGVYEVYFYSPKYKDCNIWLPVDSMLPAAPPSRLYIVVAENSKCFTAPVKVQQTFM